MKTLICSLLFLFFFQLAISQDIESSLLEDLTELIMENSDEEIDIDELTDIWESYLQTPIFINSDCADDLRKLRFLSEFQIQEVENYKKTNGIILSIYELIDLDGFSRELLENLQPFLSFDPADRIERVSRGRRELLVRSQRIVEQSRGYKEDKYAGSPEKYYLRFKQVGAKLNFGLLAEKDQGETFFSGENNKGFDYYSGYANLNIKGGKYRLFIGDYLIRAGQGLNIWQGFSNGKSTEVSQVYKANQGICPYSSVDENRFFRGLAGELNFKNISLIVFCSGKNVDANLEEENGETVFTSLQTSGLHRTESEIADKYSVNEKVAGVVFSYQKNNFSCGISGIHTSFDKRKVTGDQLYKKFLFEGKQLNNVGLNYKWSLHRLFLFGELASSLNGGWAGLQGIMLKPADQCEMSLLYRSFSTKYANLYGQAFAESSAINNEHGLYIGIQYLPISKVVILAYRDFFSHQWLKSQTASPAQGNETFLQVDYSPNTNLKFYLRYFLEQKEIKSVNNQMYVNIDRSLEKIRLNFDLELNEQWGTRSRMEIVTFKETEKEHGLLLLQTLKYKALNLPFSCQFSLAWFDSDSYDCRLYAYENDMLYNFSFPALSGQGIRSYWNAKYRIFSRLDLWFKLSRTQFFDQETVGSGWDEIEGDRKTEMKIQVRYKF